MESEPCRRLTQQGRPGAWSAGSPRGCFPTSSSFLPHLFPRQGEGQTEARRGKPLLGIQLSDGAMGPSSLKRCVCVLYLAGVEEGV